MSKIKIYIERLDKDVVLPNYANIGDSGMDIRAYEDIVIYPQETTVVKTGIKLAIPEGYEIQVRPRSGISYNTPLRVSNSPGTIDSNYKDELGIIIHNSSIVTDTPFKLTVGAKGNIQGAYEIKKGDRIAQIILQEVPVIEFEEVDDVTKYGKNRNGGFGSTGTK